MSAQTRWSLRFYDAKGQDISRGWTGVGLTDTVRRALLRFEHDEDIRYATLANNGHVFALIGVAGSYKASVTSIAIDERTLSDRETKALGHVENMLRSGVRVHLRGSIPLWRLHRPVPQRP